MEMHALAGSGVLRSSPADLLRSDRANVVFLVLTWAIVLEPQDGGSTRVLLRLRLHPVRRRRMATVVGGLVDALTVAGMASGLRERVPGRRRLD